MTTREEWALDPAVVHLNHGSFGGITRRTLDAVERARRDVEANPMRFYAREWAAVHARATTAAAEFLGADAPGLAFVTNATTALDVALRLVDWGPSARIVLTDHTYPATGENVVRRAAASGARVDVVAIDLDATDDEIVTAVLAAAEGATAAVVDAIASPTGRTFPVRRLVAGLHDRDVFTIVDGAHVPGQASADVVGLGADAWLGNLHKWAAAPKSLAALWLAPDHRARVGPVVPSSSCDGDFPANAAWQGTADAGPLLVLPEVLAEASARLAATRSQRELAARAGALLAEALEVSAPATDSWMAAVPLDLPGTRVAAADLQARIACSLGIEVAVPRWRDHLLLRVSLHVYNTFGDVVRLAEGLPRLVAETRATVT